MIMHVRTPTQAHRRTAAQSHKCAVAPSPVHTLPAELLRASGRPGVSASVRHSDQIAEEETTVE